ncbi:MAG: DNA polymerase III subunit gamma/tau [Halobacteriovoraceae bacterium]|nr:DNA polymerase III subunit gamma/tau [Halobacteriovoraceae bacterium]
MSYQVLARKWRPQTFSELVGQPHIVKALSNAVLSGQIAHAYLLTGTRGIGKTTVARLFAKAINCLNLSPEGNPCLECSSCKGIHSESSMDYLEIDGASNNSVDDIRSLVENVSYLPVNGKYKIYVIDEIHMLSNAAFNALLKTLEEPPAHVVFIFATTDPEKLLKTVLSRCQRLDFRDASLKDLENHLSDIAQREKISFEEQSMVSQIAYQARGSFRDALSLLDQVRLVSGSETITRESMSLALGMASEKVVKDFIDALFNCDQDQVTSLFKATMSEYVDLQIFCTQVLEELFFIIQTKSYQGDMGEVLWLYEILAKDTAWALKSILPIESVLLVFQKLSLRDQLFEDKKKTPLIRIHRQKIQEKKSIELKTLSWEEVLDLIRKQNVSLGINLEHAIGLQWIQTKEQVTLELGYHASNKVFASYFQDREQLLGLQNIIANLTGVNVENCKLMITELSNEEKEEKKLKTRFEQEQKRKELELAQKRENIKNNSYILQAEDIFNAKVSSIIIDE